MRVCESCCRYIKVMLRVSWRISEKSKFSVAAMVEKLAIRAKSATVKWSVPATYPVGLMKSLSQPKTSFALSSFSGPGVGPPNKTGYWKFEKYIGILQWDLVKTCFYIQGKSLNIGTFFGCKYENNWKVWNQHTLPNNKDFNFATLCLHFLHF